MVGWHHWLNEHEFEKTLGNGEGHRNLACCSPWGQKELDMTEWLNNSKKAKMQENIGPYWADQAGVLGPLCTVFEGKLMALPQKSGLFWPKQSAHSKWLDNSIPGNIKQTCIHELKCAQEHLEQHYSQQSWTEMCTYPLTIHALDNNENQRRRHRATVMRLTNIILSQRIQTQSNTEFLFFWPAPRGMWDLRSQTGDQIHNPSPVKGGILTTGPPETSQWFIL